MSTPDPRRDELRARLQLTRARIDRACLDAGRTERPTLIVVTKFFPAADVNRLAELDVRDIGENRDQEARVKVTEIADRGRLTVHFIGQLQTNKAASVARYADVVHSVDRPKLAQALGGAAARYGRCLETLIQVDLSQAPGRGGVQPTQARALADIVAATEGLNLRGVMAVAPLGADPAAAFERLAGLADGIRADHPSAQWISAGMSGDLEIAVRFGATHLRVGSAILGSRPPRG